MSDDPSTRSEGGRVVGHAVGAEWMAYQAAVREGLGTLTQAVAAMVAAQTHTNSLLRGLCAGLGVSVPPNAPED